MTQMRSVFARSVRQTARDIANGKMVGVVDANIAANAISFMDPEYITQYNLTDLITRSKTTIDAIRRHEKLYGHHIATLEGLAEEIEKWVMSNSWQGDICDPLSSFSTAELVDELKRRVS